MKKPLAKICSVPTINRRWAIIIGKRVEIETIHGHMISGFVQASFSQVLRMVDATIKRRGNDETERQSKPIYVFTDSIAIAVEL